MTKISAGELRIGNIVSLPVMNNDPDFQFEEKICLDLGYYPVKIGLSQLTDALSYGDDWAGRPTPLTEDWLLRAGFYVDGPRLVLTNDIWWHRDFEVLYLGSETLKHIQSVHHLQNLYFALTGQELVFQNKPGFTAP